MGRDDHPRLTPERVVAGQGFRLGHIQRRAEESAAVDGLIQRHVVHHAAPAHIHQDGTGLALGDPLPVEQMLRLRRAGQTQGHEVGFGQFGIQLALGHHPQTVIGTGGVRVDRAADAHHLCSQSMGTAGKVGADVSHAHAEHPGAVHAPHLPGHRLPQMLMLVIPVVEQILLQSQPHGKHPLADRQTVSTGGIGHHALLRQHPRHKIGVGTGGVGLEPADPLIPGDQWHRQIAQHQIRPQSILLRGSLGSGKTVLVLRHAGGDRRLLRFGSRQTD